ncbi:MAG: helicase, partial [Salinirussus sp.]
MSEETNPDAFYDALASVGRPVVTATRYAQVRDLSHEAASNELERLATTGAVERLDVSSDPVVWYPADLSALTDRENVILFPSNREIIVDQPTQFTRAQLSQFTHLVTTTGSGAYRYEIRREDVWAAPYDEFEALRSTVRQVLPEPSRPLEEWLEDQWARANRFTLRTHDEGYVILEAETAELMGNVARQELDDGVLRAELSDTASWVAEERVAELKRTLFEAGYPVRDERDLQTGEPLDVDLDLELRDYQREWVERFLETNAGVLV